MHTIFRFEVMMLQQQQQQENSSNSNCCCIKALDVSNMEVILRGKQWDRAEDPCNKSVIHLLERNEGLVTWLQPKVLFAFEKQVHTHNTKVHQVIPRYNTKVPKYTIPIPMCCCSFEKQNNLQGGSVEDQVPAINVNGKYFCPLSLRMQKSIWRHIRLRKGFVNLERLSQAYFFALFSFLLFSFPTPLFSISPSFH